MSYLQLIKFKLKDLWYSFRGKDTMELKIEKYRMLGANIPKDSGVRLFSPIVSSESYLITIGKGTTVSTGVEFCTHDNAIIKCNIGGTDLVGPITIGNNCFIGMKSILMPGVTIASNCIIAAGSVVTKSQLEEGYVLAGNPAKVICSVKEYAEKNKEKLFNFKGMSSLQKKNSIMNNKEKWIVKSSLQRKM